MKYAFVDIQNNDSTALKTLGFVIDNKKLSEYLVSRSKCNKVFMYPGIEISDQEKKDYYKSLESGKVFVREKLYKIYKEKDWTVKINCANCKNENIKLIQGKTSFKCNCDVDLTIDMIENVREGDEVILFTGDGDFEKLILKMVSINCIVKVVSSDKNFLRNDGSSQSRMSKKLKDLFVKYPNSIKFLELNNYKEAIQKDSL